MHVLYHRACAQHGNLAKRTAGSSLQIQTKPFVTRPQCLLGTTSLSGHQHENSTLESPHHGSEPALWGRRSGPGRICSDRRLDLAGGGRRDAKLGNRHRCNLYRNHYHTQHRDVLVLYLHKRDLFVESAGRLCSSTAQCTVCTPCLFQCGNMAKRTATLNHLQLKPLDVKLSAWSRTERAMIGSAFPPAVAPDRHAQPPASIPSYISLPTRATAIAPRRATCTASETPV